MTVKTNESENDSEGASAMKNFEKYKENNRQSVKRLNKDVLKDSYARMLKREGLNPDLKVSCDEEKLELIINKIDADASHNLATLSASYMVEIIKSKPFSIGSNRMINEKMAVLVCELFLCLNGLGGVQTISNGTMNMMADLVASDGEGVEDIAEIIRNEIIGMNS